MILALDPGTHHMGVAVLSPSELVYYGVKTFKTKRPADALIRATRIVLQQLIVEHRPAILAYEKTFYAQSKSSALLHVQEAEIKRVGRAAGLVVTGYAPTTVRSLLCQDGRATKQVVARLLIDRFPELNGYLRTASKRQEKYWLNMFDAIAVGLVCAQETDGTTTESEQRLAA
jgi:Holliday junction resolvasome RuvABC endonuclease subunit